MKKITVISVVFSLLLSCMTGFASAYEDVEEAQWYAEAVDYVTESGLMNGMAEDVFAPEEAVSRAMCVTVLWRMAGCPDPIEDDGTYSAYADVDPALWYSPGVYWAYPDIMNGFPLPQENPPVPTGIFLCFRGEDTLTREQLAAVLYRFHCHQNSIPPEPPAQIPSVFSDRDHLSPWAEEAFAWCVNEGILLGMEIDGALCLDPTGTVNRAQLATVLMRYCTSN